MRFSIESMTNDYKTLKRDLLENILVFNFNINYCTYLYVNIPPSIFELMG